jgi:glutamyl/glutaminyl-tRNA synthetase
MTALLRASPSPSRPLHVGGLQAAAVQFAMLPNRWEMSTV